MLDKKIMLALNGADDAFLEETARKLGYNTEIKERIVPMTNYRKRTSRRFISILVAACLLLSLGVVAYATDLFGIRALLIKDDNLPSTRNEEGGYLSITQPQEVPEEMDSGINDKIAKSTKAWAEWDSWRKENGIYQPEVFEIPEGCTRSEYLENDDGTYTVVFYKSVPIYGDNGMPVNIEYEEIERRIATAEEFKQDMIYAEAIAKGFKGYDFNYHVYTQDMANKLEEIAARYGLELRRERTTMYENFDGNTQFNSFDEITDRINQVCAGGKSFFRVQPTGYDKFYYYGEGTFAVSFYTTDNKTNTGTSCYLYNSPYGTLSSGFEIISEVENVSAMSTYNHISPDGTELTVLYNGADMFAYVYLENSFVTMHFNQLNGLSAEEINGIIDMVNFNAIR